jgi:hypothetical protein
LIKNREFRYYAPNGIVLIGQKRILKQKKGMGGRRLLLRVAVFYFIGIYIEEVRVAQSVWVRAGRPWFDSRHGKIFLFCTAS